MGNEINEKLKVSMPKSFGLIFDGWSDQTGYHYVATFACYCVGEDDDSVKTPLLSITPMVLEASFTAEDHVNHLNGIMDMYGRTTEDIEFWLVIIRQLLTA